MLNNPPLKRTILYYLLADGFNNLVMVWMSYNERNLKYRSTFLVYLN